MRPDFLRVYVLWDPASDDGGRLAVLVAKHFDGIGMERDGVAIRIPVRFRSEAWDVDGSLPRTIDLEDAQHNVVILLHDFYMQENADDWNGYVAELRALIDARGKADTYIPFGSPSKDPPLAGDAARHTQYARRDLWSKTLPDQADQDARILLHLVFGIRQHLRAVLGTDGRTEPLFVSHAKSDGDITTRAIIDYVNDTQNDVPLQTFYDAMELAPGENYEARFKDEIVRGTLLAIVSDIYDSRPWCIFELTTAKRARRPIVLADVGKVGTSRTFPYGANLPKVRVTPSATEAGWIELLLVQTLSEGLRCDLFQAQARQRASDAGLAGAVIFPRPPELFDLVDGQDLSGAIIYPDPPLGILEGELLGKALKAIKSKLIIRTYSEVR
jgi:hypothetical protein